MQYDWKCNTYENLWQRFPCWCERVWVGKSKLVRKVSLRCTTYSRQKFSGLSWMVKRHYIQDYSENFRGNTETRTVASDFIRPSIESSLTKRGKKRTDQACGHVVREGGQWLWWKIGWSKMEKIEERKNQWRIAVVYTINKICTGEKTSRDTSEEPQEPQRVS